MTSTWSSPIKMDDLTQSQTSLSSGKTFAAATSDGFYVVWVESDITVVGDYNIIPTAVRSKKYYTSTSSLSNLVTITEEEATGLTFASNSDSKGIVAWSETDAEKNIRIYESRQTGVTPKFHQ